mgnify:CR=1 FL=1
MFSIKNKYKKQEIVLQISCFCLKTKTKRMFEITIDNLN